MSKGKCYSMVDRGQRKKSDAYFTPYCLTRLFLDTKELDPSLSTLEPMCGEGAITKVLDEYNFDNVYSYDIIEGCDFLNEETQYSQIITNPAFSIAYETILKCKEIATERFALLLPLSYLHGQQRYENIWLDKGYPLKKVYVFTRYPMLGDPLRTDGKVRTGMAVFCWMVWEKNYNGASTIDWLNMNGYIVGKGDKENEDK